MNQLSCSSFEADGFIGYWLSEQAPESVPTITIDGKQWLKAITMIVADKPASL